MKRFVMMAGVALFGCGVDDGVRAVDALEAGDVAEHADARSHSRMYREFKRGLARFR